MSENKPRHPATMPALFASIGAGGLALGIAIGSSLNSGNTSIYGNQTINNYFGECSDGSSNNTFGDHGHNGLVSPDDGYPPPGVFEDYNTPSAPYDFDPLEDFPPSLDDQQLPEYSA